MPRASTIVATFERRLGVPAWAVAIAVGCLLLVLLREQVRPPDAAGSACVFRSLTGVPCATCGATRSVVAASRGDLIGAVRLNPLVTLGGVILVLWGVTRLVVGPRARVAATAPHARRWIAVVAVAAVLANWAYVVASVAG